MTVTVKDLIERLQKEVPSAEIEIDGHCCGGMATLYVNHGREPVEVFTAEYDGTDARIVE